MVKSRENGDDGSVAPFLRKCYEMVDDNSTDSIISWNDTGDCFVIWDMTQFSVQLLPKFFKHSNFSSFMRQLNIYVSFFLNLFFVISFQMDFFLFMFFMWGKLLVWIFFYYY